MGAKAKRCPKKCENHRFLLKPVHYSAVFSRELQASFCSSKLTDPSITPKFNKDKRHYTVCFYLPIDDIKLSANDELNKAEHQKYKMENINEKSTLNIPKPRSKYSYCNVCKIDFDDYLEHIKSVQHKNKIKDNKFNGFINETCEEMKKRLQRIKFFEEECEISVQNSESLQKMPSETQFFDFKTSSKLIQSGLPAFQYNQINDLFHSNKQFHAFSDYIDPAITFQKEQQEGILTNPPFSPMKRYSEATEGTRFISNIKPIILTGKNNLECLI